MISSTQTTPTVSWLSYADHLKRRGYNRDRDSQGAHVCKCFVCCPISDSRRMCLLLCILFCILDLRTLTPTFACVCVCAGWGWGGGCTEREGGGGDTYKHLRTEPLLGEGHWKNINSQSSNEEKVRTVDEAWAILSQRGANVRAWMEHFKWRGACGKASGKSTPRPAPAQQFEPNHVAFFPEGGKGKGKRARLR